MKNIKYFTLIALIFSMPVGAAAKSPPYFEGTLSLGPSDCQQTAQCTVQNDFGYVDRHNVGWKVNKGFKTDGASIPRWAQWFAGEPWEPTYLQAAVLHDWYSKSERPVYGWLQTQRMFREVLLQSGVSLAKANLLYSGVLIGSGKWIFRKEGTRCNFSDPNVLCMQQVGKFVLKTEEPSWQTPEFQASFAKFKSNPSALENASAEDVESLVAGELKNPIFVTEKDGVIDTTSPDFSNLAFE